jgi:hypothetical protein
MNLDDHGDPIFPDDLDRDRFVETLGEACLKTGWQVHAKPTFGAPSAPRLPTIAPKPTQGGTEVMVGPIRYVSSTPLFTRDRPGLRAATPRSRRASACARLPPSLRYGETSRRNKRRLNVGFARGDQALESMPNAYGWARQMQPGIFSGRKGGCSHSAGGKTQSLISTTEAQR